MKHIFKIIMILVVFQLTGTQVKAQNIADSTTQKINGFRAFFENLGKVNPSDDTLNMNETTISGVKSPEI